MKLLKMKKTNMLIVVMLVTSLLMSACGKGAVQTNNKSENKETEVTKVKPNLELIGEKELSSVEENKIPDVTKEKWAFDVGATKPIVSPDGKNVLVIEKDKMAWYEIESKTKKWETATYGGIYSYVINNNKLYMSEKYANKKEKKEGNVICLDVNTGKKIWKYNVQKDLAPVVKKYKDEKAKLSICCNIQMVGDKDNLYVVGSTSWEKGKEKDKCEILMAIDKNGKKLWQTESHGYPGMLSMSQMSVIDGVLVMGNYSYNDKTNGPASVKAYDISNGKEAWKFDIKNDQEMSYSKTTNVSVGVVGNKIVAVASHGKIYVLDSKGNKIKEFDGFKPEKYKDIVLCTSITNSSIEFGKNEIIIAPKKTVVKGASNYNAKSPAQHSDVGMIKVFDLDGNLKWKFRIGGSVTNIAMKGNYLFLATSHNQDTMDYKYCGVYAFDISKDGKGKEIDVNSKDAVEKYIGYYSTDGAIIYNCLSVSDDGKVICATTWPTRVGTEKHGKHSLYMLKLN
ncbi:outer membrane protein assembly factor BamB [Clostridium tetanomorphum]|uniref:outer membrane protein assembly factor BamB family protein n=1 Tax=Clostridium tetanomorphum TaxID=1553 RepID=UPI00044B5F1C|nr:PQQ-binding-like beta-propeller repeat protein [Clostridium tetanomorphum]KAJ52365.1 pyrrolo-quinoline quinone repeat-containing protein [Clostridium tetanomorphum DSM 665]MBP1864800.1 outer membrane protein assembly factor BamB [Clostridium tetanomorphum]NRS83976.1 outer membrane protein assembly factor BamB [Clostridium tetanomorphum]